jgi:hypothetical protein
MFEAGSESDLNFAVSQAMVLAAGGRLRQDPTPWWTRLLSALLLILSVVAVGVAWHIGGTVPAIIAALLCLAVLVGCSVFLAWGGGPGGGSDTAARPKGES